MTRTIATLIAVAILSGCGVAKKMDAAIRGQPPANRLLSTYEARCESVEFPQYATCLRSGLSAGYPAWRSDPHADLTDVYLAWLDAAGMRVNDGRMEEPEARLGAAEMKVRLKQIASERATNASARQAAATSRMLTGLALLQMAQPQQAYAPAPASGPITCTQYPTNTVYGQTQIVCR